MYYTYGPWASILIWTAGAFVVSSVILTMLIWPHRNRK